MTEDRPHFSAWPSAAWGTALLTLLATALVAGCGGGGSPSPKVNLEPEVGEAIEVGGTPTAIAVGEGRVWFVDNGAGTVGSIDPVSRRPVGKPLEVGSGPAAIAVGEGAVWVASGDDSVYRVDPADRTASQLGVEIGDPRGIAAGEGSVWVTSSIDNTLVRLEPTSLEQVGEPIPVGGRPGDVVVGDGRVWVVGNEDGTVTEIDADSGEVTQTIDAGEFGAFALALADDGLWVARANDRLARQIQLLRIDPDSGDVDEDPIPLPGAAIPVRLAAGEGALWATILGGVRPPSTEQLPSEVAYLPTGSSKLPSDRLEVPEGPAGIAVGESTVWVTAGAEGLVTPISPTSPSAAGASG